MTEQAYKINGMTLFNFPNEAQNSFCLGLYARAGSLFESRENNGITHFLEHIIFRSIKHKYGSAFYELLALNGLSFSGTTYNEFVCFSIDGPVFGYEFACEVLCSVFAEIQISKEEFDLERKRIKAEIREDDQRHSMKFFSSQQIWRNTSNDKLIVGYCDVLDRMTVSKLEVYRRQVFAGNNCFFYGTGNINAERINVLIQRLQTLHITTIDNAPRNEVSLSEGFFHRDGFIKVKDSRYHSVWFSFDENPGKFTGGVNALIYQILFSGDKALLYRFLSEDTGLVYSYNSTHEQYDNVGCYQFNYDIMPHKLEDSVSCVVDTLCALKRGNFHFEANLSYEISTWLTLLDNPPELNWSLAYNNHILKTDPIIYSEKGLGKLSSVTKETVMVAAREIFRTDNLTIVIEGNKRKINTERIAQILGRLNEACDP